MLNSTCKAESRLQSGRYVKLPQFKRHVTISSIRNNGETVISEKRKNK